MLSSKTVRNLVGGCSSSIVGTLIVGVDSDQFKVPLGYCVVDGVELQVDFEEIHHVVNLMRGRHGALVLLVECFRNIDHFR